MTEKALDAHRRRSHGSAGTSTTRWSSIGVGELAADRPDRAGRRDSSAHRGDAFAACEFIIDYLKTQAPFWKKELTPDGERWVEARASDDDAAARW